MVRAVAARGARHPLPARSVALKPKIGRPEPTPIFFGRTARSASAFSRTSGWCTGQETCASCRAREDNIGSRMQQPPRLIGSSGSRRCGGSRWLRRPSTIPELQLSRRGPSRPWTSRWKCRPHCWARNLSLAYGLPRGLCREHAVRERPCGDDTTYLVHDVIGRACQDALLVGRRGRICVHLTTLRCPTSTTLPLMGRGAAARHFESDWTFATAPRHSTTRTLRGGWS